MCKYMATGKDSVQAYVYRLMKEYRYPKDCIRTEFATSFGRARYRLDIVVMNEGKPYIVVEIKRNISDVSLDQLLGYVRATGAKFAVASDGDTDHCYIVDSDGYETRLQKIPDIPTYGSDLKVIGLHSNAELVSIDSGRLDGIIWEIADVYRRQGLSKEEALRDILKVLLLKVYDENSKEGLFRAKFGEPPENVQSRINALAMKAAKKYPSILREPILLKYEPLTIVVQILQKYSLKKSAQDAVGSKLPISEILGPRSYVQTMPRDLIRLTIDLLSPKKGARFIDPACGIGGLLVEAAKRGAEVTGIERNIGVAQYAEVNLALFGLTGEVLVRDILDINYEATPVESGSYDCAGVNPPYGLRINDRRLTDFFLGTTKRSQFVEALLLERTLRLLKTGGRMAIVLPESLLFFDSTYDVREFILRRSIVKAIISLPAGTFSPFSSIKTSLLILESSPDKGTSPETPVFVAIPQGAEEFESIVSGFTSFRDKGAVSAWKNAFVTRIASARQMTASYLRGSLSADYAEARMGLLPDVEPSKAELQELVTFTTGVNLGAVGEEDPSGDIWYVRAGNVDSFFVDWEQGDLLKTNRDVSRWKPSPGDILMTRAGTVGRVALVEEQSPPIIVGTNVVKITIRDKRRLLPEFLLGYLSSTEGKNQIGYYTGGSTIRAISISKLGQMKIPVPPMETQRKIAEQIRKLIQTTRESRRAIYELKVRERKLSEELDSLIRGG